MTDTRIMPCEMCGGEGGWWRDDTGNAFGARNYFYECPACLGSGEVEIELVPVDESDVSTLPSISSSSDGGR